MRFKFLLLLLLTAISVYFIYLHRGPETVKKGDLAPAFALPAKNFSVRLDQYKGNVVLLNFWATWCPACLKEIPSLQNLNKQLQGKKFQLLAIHYRSVYFRLFDN